MWFWVDVENYGVDEIRKRIGVLRELFLRHYNRKTTTPLMKETLQNMIAELEKKLNVLIEKGYFKI
jgi:hypothetical protein